MAEILTRTPEFVVVGTAGTVAEARRLMDTARPDLVVLDVDIAGGDGLELIKCLRSLYANMSFLVVSSVDEDLYAERAISAGADGFMTKAEPSDRLIAALRAVAAGDLFLRANTALGILKRTFRRDAPAPSEGIEKLSSRELHVFRLIGTGHSTREIAERLGLSIKTVESHREHIKTKLCLADGAALVGRAREWVRQSGCLKCHGERLQAERRLRAQQTRMAS